MQMWMIFVQGGGHRSTCPCIQTKEKYVLTYGQTVYLQYQITQTSSLENPSLWTTPLGTRFMAPLLGILPGNGLIYVSSTPSASPPIPQSPWALHRCVKISPTDVSFISCKRHHPHRHFRASPHSQFDSAFLIWPRFYGPTSAFWFDSHFPIWLPFSDSSQVTQGCP